jgi:predicted glutamine amidotransferase
MCRLAAFPPHFSREKAIDILLQFEGCNTDGVGSAYLSNGKFIVDKHPTSLTDLLSAGHPFLGHMPYNAGWTIAHLRAASHGENAHRNTHPFIVGAGNREAGEGEWCIAHNGIWSDYSVVKLALSKFVKFSGETDSEVAAELINLVGPKAFSEEVTFGGVYLSLNKNGDLWAVKTSGDLECFHRTDKTILLASDLDGRKYRRAYEHERGWYRYNKHGKYVAHAIKETSAYSSHLPEYVWGGRKSRNYSPSAPAGNTQSIPQVTQTPMGMSQAQNTQLNQFHKPPLCGAPNGREWWQHDDTQDEYERFFGRPHHD